MANDRLRKSETQKETIKRGAQGSLLHRILLSQQQCDFPSDPRNFWILSPFHAAFRAAHFLTTCFWDENPGCNSLMRSSRAAKLVQQLSIASWVVPMARGYGLSADFPCSMSSRILDTTCKSFTIQNISFRPSWTDCQKSQSFWTPPAAWADRDTTAKALAAPDKPSLMRLSETRTQKLCSQAAYVHTLSVATPNPAAVSKQYCRDKTQTDCLRKVDRGQFDIV